MKKNNSGITNPLKEIKSSCNEFDFANRKLKSMQTPGASKK